MQTALFHLADSYKVLKESGTEVLNKFLSKTADNVFHADDEALKSHSLKDKEKT